MRIKKLIALCFALIVIFLCSVAVAAGYSAVITDKCTVHAKATSTSKELGTLKKNQAVTLIETANGWSKIELNGNVGYVRARYVKKTVKTMYVDDTTMTLYASNKTSSKQLATYSYGQKVTVNATSGSWAKVTVGKTEGYCKTSCLTSTNPNNLDKTVYTQQDGIKVYKAPTTSAKVIATVKSGMKLKLTSIIDNNWCRVLNGSTVGFIQKKYLAETKPKDTQSEELNFTVYTQKDYVPVYKSARTSSEVISKLNANTKLTCTKIIDDTWCRVKNGSSVGYIKKSLLDTSKASHLSTMSKTVYTQKDDVKVYTDSTTSSTVLATLDRNTKLTCTAILDDTWCRVKNGSSYGYIHKSYLGEKKVNAYSTAVPASGASVSVDWFKGDINRKFAKGETAVITDVATGISWRIHRTGGYNHADVQPLTKEDTAAMKKACGSDYDTWNRRPVWVSVDGQKYAASMNCKPHGDGSISTNNFNGHHCIHFTNSRTHGTNSVCSLHQSAIRKALKAG